MDIDTIKNRIIEFLRNENLTSAQFAQEIGVQPSGISHIISGRNKPSLEFILKMISRYPSLSTEWLIFGKGQMFNENSSRDLFSEGQVNSGAGEINFDTQSSGGFQKTVSGGVDRKDISNESAHTQSVNTPRAARIVIFNEDGSFSEHFPA